MEKILVIDAVSFGISTAIIADGELLCDFTMNNRQTHSQGLMPLVDFSLKSTGLEISDIDKIICTNGPGSFTGLRIALSTVKGLAHFHNIPIESVSSLRSLSMHDLFFEGVICPIMDARRSQVYCAAYQNGEEIFEEDTRIIDDLLLQLQGKRVLFVGDGILKYKKKIREASSDFFVGDVKYATNPAFCAYRAYKKGFSTSCNYQNLDVNYLRVPEAQRNLEEKANR